MMLLPCAAQQALLWCGKPPKRQPWCHHMMCAVPNSEGCNTFEQC
jgi:hypothetical protein